MRDYSYDELDAGIDKWVVNYRNAERDRYILKLKLIKGLSYVQIADVLNAEGNPESYKIGVRQIQRRIRKAETLLFRHI